MHTVNLDYKDGNVTCEAYVAYDDAKQGKRPAVLISHAWAGQTDFERKKAEELAKLGYVGIALDNYSKGVRGDIQGDNSHLMMPFMNDRAMLRKRLLAGLAMAQEHPMVDPSKVAVMGYCFGGLCALDLARTAAKGLLGAVSFHGLFTPPGLGQQPKITAKVLILHGYDDPMAKPDTVLAVAKELSDAQADWQIHAYGGTLHAFTNPGANAPERGLQYSKAADQRSWEAMKDFFQEILV